MNKAYDLYGKLVKAITAACQDRDFYSIPEKAIAMGMSEDKSAGYRWERYDYVFADDCHSELFLNCMWVGAPPGSNQPTLHKFSIELNLCSGEKRRHKESFRS